MTEDIYTKAQVLADAISGSQELAELKQAEKVMLADAEAQQIITDFHNLQEKLMTEGSEEPTDEETQAIESMEAKVESHPVISTYLTAQDNFTMMLDKVNAILAAAIAGEDKDGGCGCDDKDCDSGDCGGGCC